MPKVWILYVTFARDLEWIRYSLESIKKYGSGFAGITVVVPTIDKERFRQFERYSSKDCQVVIKDFLEYPGKGFVHHLGMKCYGDVLCPQADYILHMDPDCLFHIKFSPDDYFTNGKPDLVIEPYEALKEKHPGRYHWKSVTEAALKFDCTHETMCRHPAVHPRHTYFGLRHYMAKVHETPFLDFVLKAKNKFPMGFGEFNTLGAYALKFHPDDYNFIDRGFDGESVDPLGKVTQMWSYEGTKKNLEAIKKILE